MTAGEIAVHDRIDEVYKIVKLAISRMCYDRERYEYSDMVQNAVLGVLERAYWYDPTKYKLSTFVYKVAKTEAYRKTIMPDERYKRGGGEAPLSLDSQIDDGLTLGDVIRSDFDMLEDVIPGIDYGLFRQNMACNGNYGLTDNQLKTFRLHEIEGVAFPQIVKMGLAPSPQRAQQYDVRVKKVLRQKMRTVSEGYFLLPDDGIPRCRRCFRPLEEGTPKNRLYCDSCQIKKQEADRAKINQRTRYAREAKLTHGRCTTCGKPLPDGWKRVSCEVCMTKNREAQRARKKIKEDTNNE